VNDQERQVIADIFRRLEGVAHQPRDPEAERFIAERLRQQPYAPYAMAQSIFVQEQALANLNAELEALRAEVAELRRQPQGGGGFLSSIFGGGDRGPERRPGAGGTPWGRAGAQAHQPFGGPQGGYPPGGGYQQGGGPMQGGPWGGGGMMQPRGGGFLQGALATAAGVAGGMMVANALSHAFSGDNNPVSDAASSLAGLSGKEGGAEAGSGDQGGVTDGMYQDASANDQDFSDFSGDAGDGGDWA
jgi:uncharacterized protein